MEQFNLEKYLQAPTRKVVTRDGNPVRIICTDGNITRNGHDMPIVALVSCKDGSEELFTTTANGLVGIYKYGNNDLFFVPQKQSRWIFLYYNEALYVNSSMPYYTKAAAEKELKRLNGFSLTEITWEE